MDAYQSSKRPLLISYRLHDVCNHLYDAPYLQNHPLCDRLVSEEGVAWG